MTRILRCGSLIGGLMLGLACGTEQPTAPSAVPAPPTITQPPSAAATTSFGPTRRDLRFQRPARGYPVSGFTTGSQYLLYDNGVFGLRYDAFAHVYLGTYRQDNATITFRFDDAWTWDQGWSCLSDSVPRAAYARSRRGPSRGTCWRSATATACSTRTSRTPSTGDSLSELRSLGSRVQRIQSGSPRMNSRISSSAHCAPWNATEQPATSHRAFQSPARTARWPLFCPARKFDVLGTFFCDRFRSTAFYR